MQSHLINYKSSVVHYNIYGNGTNALFCFHGYGKDSSSFEIFEPHLGSRFTLIAIDLPYHGETYWRETRALQPETLSQLMFQILSSHKLPSEKFSLFGFSMGGRISLQLTQILAPYINKLVLVAPDGINFNFWRWLSTDTLIGSQLLGYTRHHPKWVLWILNTATKWKIIHKSMANFIHFYLDDDKQRQLLFLRWMAMRKFIPSISKIKQQVKKHNIPVRMMFGKFDRVISIKGGKNLMQGIEPLTRITEIEAGHNLLTPAHAPAIAQLFND